MKRFPFLFTVPAFFLISCGGDNPTTPGGRPVTFELTVGEARTDKGYGVCQTADGGYVMAGATESYTATGVDMLIVKTDGRGGVQWKKVFGGKYDEYAYAVCEAADGGIVVCGSTDSWGRGGSDVLLVKLSADGEYLWQKEFGGASDDEAYALRRTSDGGYILAGFSDSYGGTDMFLVKSGGDGTLQWMQTYGGGSEDAALDVRECVDGGFVLAGMTYSYGRYGEAFLVKTDRDGAEEWHQNYPGDGPVQAVGVVAQNDGGYLLAGTCMTYQPNDVNGWLMKVEENGRQVWRKSFGGLREDIFLGMDAALGGGCFVCGYTYSMGAGGSDGWILKFDSAGKLVWEHPRGGSGYDKFYGVRATADGGCVAAGEKEGDAWLVKMDGNGL